uniref:C2 domain-containing protein n=1 Tax=Peronospora matthiolae TaxID=2874970 RepID=A0AAV1UUE9_9STRA
MSHYRRSSMSRMSVSSSVAAVPTALRNDAILYLTIMSGRELKKVQTLGEQDPYCSVYLTTGGAEQEKAAFKTDTHDNGGTQPMWNAKGHVLIPDISSDVIRFRVKNNNWGKNTVIGEIALAMRDLSRGRSMEREFALTPKGYLKVLMYLSLGHENPTSQPRVKFGEYPQHFIPGKTKLYVGLISGSKLRDIQSFGTQDPLCEVFIGRSRTPSAKDLVYKTKTHDNGGKNPRWIEGFTVSVRCIEHDFLVIRVMNHNTVINTLIGELCLKVELLISRMFEDKSYPIEADDTIVGQVRLQLALFNDEIMNEDEIRDCDVDGCSCTLTQPVRATKVGNVLIDGISPDGVQYLEAGTAVHTGCEIAGDYVMDKDVYEGSSWQDDRSDLEQLDSDEWEGDEL